MMQPDAATRSPLPRTAPLVLLLLLLLTGCAAAPVQPTAAPGEPTASSAPPSIVPDFPLAGTWSGTAVNGSVEMLVTLTIKSACATGLPCGTFDIPLVPCTGTYVLAGEENGQYEFDITDKSASCGRGRDYLQLRPDGTLQFISRGDYGENFGVLTLAGAPSAAFTELPVIFDDDGSPDGTTALLYLISEQSVSLEAVTVSHGEAHPEIYIQHMGRMLEDFGITDIPLGAGQETAIVPGEDFPDWLRQASDGFWGFPVPNAAKTYPVQSAAEVIVSVLNQAPARVTIFVSGPCTDLAQALRLDPTIQDRIAAVYIMGGAVFVPGNLTDFSTNPANVSAEWNIYIDPSAASEVFESGLPIYLVPLDATDQVTVTTADTAQWRTGGRVADFAADIYDMLLGGSDTAQMALWDVMTAEIMVHPELCEMTPLHLHVVTQVGNTYGQTAVVTGGQPNIQVCLKPDVSGIRRTLGEALTASE